MARRRTGFSWLIELATSAVSSPLYLRGCPTDESISWTRDHNDAMPFATEAAAKAFVAKHVDEDVRVCEHGWA